MTPLIALLLLQVPAQTVAEQLALCMEDLARVEQLETQNERIIEMAQSLCEQSVERLSASYDLLLGNLREQLQERDERNAELSAEVAAGRADLARALGRLERALTVPYAPWWSKLCCLGLVKRERKPDLGGVP